ncbi:uncharacterized protein LOC123713987 isoform X1 [Pieris brassicae]|nr:uncharacterized protein LOC123713987 isoform X1 [Pieris brassicae]
MIMTHYWIIITISWIGSASLQYINSAGMDGETFMDPLDSSVHFPPLPYVNYFNYPSRNDYETIQNDENVDHSEFYPRNHDQSEVQRKRRTVDDQSGPAEPWKPNLVDLDKTLYIRNDDKTNPFVIKGLSGRLEENATDLINSIEKRSFSPWGGKRDGIEQMWTWKRSQAIREPSMPKRVRFSPWGGKRSGQMIYKPGSKASKVIFSTSVPELTRIVSNYSPKGRLDLAGFQIVPSLDKRHPIKILALSTQFDEKTAKDALPFNTFMENLPKYFKLGHPYLDVNLKKDGKRKVKFSAWGGKRSPPIIGPIWTPAAQNVKDSTLDSIVLIRNRENEDV